MANLADKGRKFADYHSGLEHFFLYVQGSRLKERISFRDNYAESSALRRTPWAPSRSSIP